MRNYRKWLLVPFIIFAIVYACTSEQDYEADNGDQTVEPLTVAMAQSLYEQYVGTTSRLKSDVEKDDLEMKPNWNAGQIFSDSNWYVVESPLEPESGFEVQFMTSDVSDLCAIGGEDVKPEQIVRQIIMRNKETGYTYAFVMVVMPDLDYIQANGNSLQMNAYLSRTSDLSGTIVYYSVDGIFINGWVYKNGEIIAGSQSRNMKSATKGLEVGLYCWIQHFKGSDYESERLICENYVYYSGVGRDALWMGDDAGAADFTMLMPMNGGGGTSAATNNNKKDDPDCGPNATQNSDNAIKALNGAGSKVDELRNLAKTSDKEWSSMINKGTFSDYAMPDIVGGTFGSAPSNCFSSTIYTLHTHTYAPGLSNAPSVADVYNVISHCYDWSGTSSFYKGSIIFTSEGREYLIAIDDRNMLLANAKNNLLLFKAAGNGGFANITMFNDHSFYLNGFKQMGHNIHDASLYAMIAMLKEYKTGLKISIRENKNTYFKEKNVVNNTPTGCK